MSDWIGDLRNVVLRHAARVLLKSGTFRCHLGAFDRDLDPRFLRAAGLIRNDFARWEVRLFSIEHNLTVREQALDTLMFKNGYERRYATYSAIDAWYRKVAR